MLEHACRCLVCGGHVARAELDSVDAGLVRGIGEPGWTVIGVFNDDGSPGWSFTVGLWHSYRVPEIAVFGLDLVRRHLVLDQAGHRVRDGLEVYPGRRVDGLLDDDVPVLFQPVHVGWRQAYFGTAIGFYRDTPRWPILQGCWPDQGGRFPGDGASAVGMDEPQPWLWLDPEDHPPGTWTGRVWPRARP